MKAVSYSLVLLALSSLLCAQQPPSIGPGNQTGPIISRIDPTSAAPGMTVRIYGTNLNQPGLYGPSVKFESAIGTVPAIVVNDGQLLVTVPHGKGSTSLYVATAPITRSNSVPFVFKSPKIVGVTPSVGTRGQVVTILGEGFGLNQGLDPTSFVKFGDSLAVAVQWQDQKIVVKAPFDYGTGTTKDIILALLNCAGGQPTSEAVAWVLDNTLGDCSDLIAGLAKEYQLQTNPGSLDRSVNVIVQTPAGISAPQSFVYKVAQFSNTSPRRPAPVSAPNLAVRGAYADSQDPATVWMYMLPDGRYFAGGPDDIGEGIYKIDRGSVRLQPNATHGEPVKPYNYTVDPLGLRQPDYPRLYVRLDSLPQMIAHALRQRDRLTDNEALALGTLCTINAAQQIFATLAPSSGRSVSVRKRSMNTEQEAASQCLCFANRCRGMY
jgi:hypothetical protein